MPIKLSGDDYIEIQQLYARYALALDTGDGDKVAATFAPGGDRRGVLTPEEFRVRTNLKGSERHLPLGSRHLTFNLVIEGTEEGAHGTACLLFILGTFEDNVIRGHLTVYDDTLVKLDEGWRFLHRYDMDNSPDSPYGRIVRPVPPPGEPVPIR